MYLIFNYFILLELYMYYAHTYMDKYSKFQSILIILLKRYDVNLHQKFLDYFLQMYCMQFDL